MNCEVEILEAMLRGQYVLSSEWLNTCLKTSAIVDEEKYEINVINRDGQLVAKGSCAAARKNRAKMVSKLL
ncbi:unnamed protein product [Gongylonema pulchrum]|uniref:BRCT domain-containing protein n=1 Tax=Gongylonema pulchrum TaxID=637853 RepID=A0A183D1F1_9BILA|nr:unnamed protein product [Gongylonema pulchrum]